MRHALLSKETILAKSTLLVKQQGLESINIRSVANVCDVSVGSIYNYFDCKSDLITATVENIWNDIFCRPNDPSVMSGIQNLVIWIYKRMAYGEETYPGFFTFHSVAFLNLERQSGKEKMHQSWQHVRQILCTALSADPKIRPDAFNDQFTETLFAEILFSLILSSFVQENYNPDPILKLIQKTVY